MGLGVEQVRRRGLVAVGRGRCRQRRVGRQLGIEEGQLAVLWRVEGMVAGLDEAGGVARLLQDGYREVLVVDRGAVGVPVVYR